MEDPKYYTDLSEATGVPPWAHALIDTYFANHPVPETQELYKSRGQQCYAYWKNELMYILNAKLTITQQFMAVPFLGEYARLYEKDLNVLRADVLHVADMTRHDRNDIFKAFTTQLGMHSSIFPFKVDDFVVAPSVPSTPPVAANVPRERSFAIERSFSIFTDQLDDIVQECTSLNRFLKFKREQAEWTNRDNLDRIMPVLMDCEGWIEAWSDDGLWFNYPIMYYGNVLPAAARLCPKTSAAMSAFGGIVAGGFSLLMPHAIIPPHNDPMTTPAQGRKSAHIGLRVPPNECFLLQDGKYTVEANGAVFSFDGAIEHCAVNMSDKPRAILYLDYFLSADDVKTNEDWIERSRYIREQIVKSAHA